MRRGVAFLAGLITGIVCAFGCANGGGFIWRHYAPEMPAECYERGTLVGKPGKDGWTDLSMKECEPDPEPSPGASPGIEPVRLKCQILKEDDFRSLKKDDETCHADLIACEKKCQQGR